MAAPTLGVSLGAVAVVQHKSRYSLTTAPRAMVTTRRDPYLWLHLSGLATVPIWLDGCLAGLSVGDPIAPSTVEIALLAIVGIVPVLVMQWRRPFYLFSLLVVTLQPKALMVPQRQLLQLQRHWLSRGLSLAIAALLGWLLVVIYQLAPIASEVTPFTSWGHAGGWCVAAGCFWGANLFLQVSLSALRLLLARPRAVAGLEPYPLETVLKDFTVVGLRLGRILPPDLMPMPAVAAAPMGDVAPLTQSAPPPSATAAPPDELTPQPSVLDLGAEKDLEADKMDGLTPEPSATDLGTDRTDELSLPPLATDFGTEKDLEAEKTDVQVSGDNLMEAHAAKAHHVSEAAHGDQSVTVDLDPQGMADSALPSTAMPSAAHGEQHPADTSETGVQSVHSLLDVVALVPSESPLGIAPSDQPKFDQRPIATDPKPMAVAAPSTAGDETAQSQESAPATAPAGEGDPHGGESFL